MKCTDAKPMILLRRRIAVNADLSGETQMDLVKAIDKIRMRHADKSPNCECWTRALAELSLARNAA